MHLPRALVAVLGCALLILAGCGSTTVPPSASAKPAFLPVAVSSEFGVGDRRVAWGLLDATGTKSAAAPDRTLAIGYRGPKGETIPSAPLTFVWAQEGVKGIYVGRANFTSAGQWIADFTSAATGATPATVSFSFPVAERTQVLGPGDPAPSVKTPTLADVGGDCPDIMVGYGGKTFLMELKSPGGKVTPGQIDFQAKWRGGPLRVVESIDAALRFIGCMRDVPPPY